MIYYMICPGDSHKIRCIVDMSECCMDGRVELSVVNHSLTDMQNVIHCHWDHAPRTSTE